MMLSLPIIGDRLKALRTHLNLRQEDVAKNIGINQNVISRIENGTKGGRLDTFNSLFNYYKNFFYMDNFLSDNFTIIELSSVSDENKFQSIAAEKLKLLSLSIQDEVSIIVHLLER